MLASSVDPWERRKPDACLRMVRLAEPAPERPVLEGSRRQVRNDHGPVSSEPANARLTAETKPFRGRETSLPAYSHHLFTSLVSNSTSRKMISLYLSPGLRTAHAVDHHRLDLDEAIGTDRAAWVAVPRRWAVSRRRHGPHISCRDQSPPRAIPNDSQGGCRHVANRGATADLSVSRSDRDIDRQVQLDETRLQQRHGQVIAQFNPGVGVAWRPPELLEDDLARLPKR